MALRIKIKYLLVVAVFLGIQSCVTNDDLIFSDDVEIIQIKNSVRSQDCLNQEKNVIHSDLINLDGIKWDVIVKNGDTYTAISSNPEGNDSLILEIPLIFDNTFTEYPCSLSFSANRLDSEKLRIKPQKYNVNIDSRSDSLYIYLCQYYIRSYVANQEINAIYSTCLAVPNPK